MPSNQQTLKPTFDKWQRDRPIYLIPSDFCRNWVVP